MKANGRWIQPLLTAFLLVLTGIAWAAFAPLQVGGLASYVIVNGVSMEPHFKHGDLVIVRRALEYQIGEIAAYRSPDLGGNVLHRIIGQDLDRFIFQGDNNTWLDTYRPETQEIIGKLWVHVPKLGKAILWVRVPLNMAFTVAIIGGMTMAGSLLEKPERKGGKKVKNKSGGMPPGSIEAALLVLGLVLLASLAVGIYAFTHPVWRQADPVEYEHQGAFSYTAHAPAGVYDGKTVQTGEPIFPALTCSLNMTFSYALSFDGLQGAGGSYQIAARISEEQSNWQRSIPLVDGTAFSGKSFESEVRIDLCNVEDLVAAMEEATDFHPSSYKLEIIPNVTTSGTFAGQGFEDTFAPILLFRFDALHFYLNRELEGDPLHPIQTSLLPDPTLVQDRLPLFGAEPRVISLRILAVVGVAISSLGLLALVLLLANTSRRDPQAYIHMKYGSLLVDVSNRQSVTTSKIIEVASIDSLARIAEGNNAMIIHDLSAAVPSYYVDIAGNTYRYQGNAELDAPKRKRRKDGG